MTTNNVCPPVGLAVMSSDIDSTYLAPGKTMSETIVNALVGITPDYSREQLFRMLARWNTESFFARDDVQKVISGIIHNPLFYADCPIMPEARAMFKKLRNLLPVRLFVSIRKEILRGITVSTLGEVDGAKIVLCPNSIPDSERTKWKVSTIFRIATVFARKGNYILKAHVDDDPGLVKHWSIAWHTGVRLLLLGQHKIREAGVTVCRTHADVVRAAELLADERV